jgi:L-threonylcarbamoyladenylate synthase
VNTLRLTVDPQHLDHPESRRAIERAAEILRNGGLVALPTETVYGLGANALDPAAVARIFAAKNRPSWDPIIVHIAGPATPENPMLRQLVTEIPETARKLIAAFWPGPLTLLLPRSAVVPDAVTAGRPLVGIRMPAHPVATQLICAAGVPVAAPSANLFSHTSPTTADHVLQDLDGRIDAILNAGQALHGVESTVLDPTRTPMIIYRPGAVTARQISAVAGEVATHSGCNSGLAVDSGPAIDSDPAVNSGLAIDSGPAVPRDSLPSPGVGIRHYAPKARLILIDAPFADLPNRLAEAFSQYSSSRVGIMLPLELTSVTPSGATVYPWGHWDAPEELAHSLYSGLRSLDDQNCSVILCPEPPAEGIGAAIRDRLRKAAWTHEP